MYHSILIYYGMIHRDTNTLTFFRCQDMAHASCVPRPALSPSCVMRPASRIESVMRHASGVPPSCHASWLMRHGSCVMAHASGVMRHGSCVRRHGSCVMAHGSWLMRHGSWLMAHASWLMAHGSCVPRGRRPFSRVHSVTAAPLSVMTTTGTAAIFPYATALRFAPVELYGMG